MLAAGRAKARKGRWYRAGMRPLLLGLLVTLGVTACAGSSSSTTTTPTSPTPGYDAARAQRLGADAYGMKSYVLALLYRGPNRPTDPQESQALQRAHLDNIGRLAAEGKLVLAGPMGDDGDLRGIYVFDVATVEEAEALTRTDPAIQRGSLRMELHPWYGSAALGEVSAIHAQIAKQSI